MAWLVLKLSGGAVDLGFLATVNYLPMLVLSPWAGALVDRHDHRRMLIATQATLGVLSALLTAATALHLITVPALFVFAAAGGAVASLSGPAAQIYPIDLVGRERVLSAITLNEIVINSSRMIGPAIAAVVLSKAGVAACLLINAVSYFVAVWVLITNGDPHRNTAAAPEPSRGGVRAGLRYSRSNPVLLWNLAMAVPAGMLFNLAVVPPLVAKSDFRHGASGYALIVMAFGVGALFGAVLATATSRGASPRGVRLLAIATGICVLVTGLASTFDLWLLGTAVSGMASIWYFSRSNALVQLTAARDMRGRVMSLWGIALYGSVTLTGPLAGWLADSFGARLAWIVPGAVLLAGGGLASRSASGHSSRRTEAL